MKKLIAVVAMALVLCLGVANAGVTTTELYDADYTAYAGDVSASDLLHGIAISTTFPGGDGWHPASGIGAVNDGFFDDGDTDAIDDVAYTDHGYWYRATADFGVATDIGSLVTIVGWDGQTAGQYYTVAFGYDGDPDNFIDAITVDYRPGNGGSKVTVYDDASTTLASNVRKMRVSVYEDNGSPPLSGGFRQWYREWDVLAPAAGGGEIPEPAGLGLVGLALLAVRKRRS